MTKLACSLYVFLQDSWVRAERVLVNPQKQGVTIWTGTHRDQLNEVFPVFFEAQGTVYSYLCRLETMSFEKECYRYGCHVIGPWTH